MKRLTEKTKERARRIAKRRLRQAARLRRREQLQAMALGEAPDRTAFYGAETPVHRRTSLDRTTVWAPQTLSLESSTYVEMIDFLDKIRTAAFTNPGGVFVNLRDCEKVTPEIVALLTAELHRIRFLMGYDAVIGRSPANHDARRMLHAMGFFDALQMRDPVSLENGENSLAYFNIHTGTSLDGKITKDIAVAFADVLGLSDDFRENIQKALNEALENISEHAYISNELLAYPAEHGRWWISSVTIKDSKTAYLLACDLGVTIPATVPETARKRGKANIAALARFLRGQEAGDENLLAAAFEDGVTRRPDQKGGRGLGKMAALVNEFPDGNLAIWSGNAAAMVSKATPTITTMPLPKRINGTYVIWHLRQDMAS